MSNCIIANNFRNDFYFKILESKTLKNYLLEKSLLDDGSILIELYLPYGRIGINIEKNHKESGFYFVSKEISGCGPLHKIDFDKLIEFAETCV